MNKIAGHKNYPAGTPDVLPPSNFANLNELLSHAAQQYGDSTAFVNMGKRLSYRAVDKAADNFAAFLQHVLQLPKGAAVAIQMPNLLQYPVALFGILRGGYSVVNVNPLYTARELKHQLKDSDAKAIVVLENFADKVQEVLSDTAIRPDHVIITRVGDMLPALKGTLIHLALRYVKRAIPAYQLPEAMSFPLALKKGGTQPVKPVSLAPDDIAFLQYTGGTTGTAKAAVLTHHNILSNIEQMRQWLYACQSFGKEEIIITALPIYHIFSLTCNVFCMYTLGATNVLVTNPRDMNSFIGTLTAYPFSFFSGVNTLFKLLMQDPRFARLNFSKLKISVAGGMALEQEVAERWETLTGCELLEGYGLSETSPVVCVNMPGSGRAGIGTPVVGTEVRIFDEKGKVLPVGKTGELCVRGPQVMRMYWRRTEETATSFFGDFFRTGDMAVEDEKGFFNIVGRKKEMILVSGFNVYPDEVEAVLGTHPQILEAGVMGVPNEQTGEAVKAFIVAKDASLTQEAVQAHCAGLLTNYKRPSEIVFVTSLPKSNVGKVLRRLLPEAPLAK